MDHGFIFHCLLLPVPCPCYSDPGAALLSLRYFRAAAEYGVAIFSSFWYRTVRMKILFRLHYNQRLRKHLSHPELFNNTY
jgi:hypothetical protein